MSAAQLRGARPSTAAFCGAFRNVATFCGLAVLVATGLTARAQPVADAPETIYFNAVIHTVDDAQPSADALAVRGSRVLAVGALAEVQKKCGPIARRVDLRGRCVLPGLIDAHGHMAGLGSYALGQLDLSSARSLDDVVAAVRERVRTARPGEWILGGRWDHESWATRELPTHAPLSAVSPLNPVWLTRVDGHAGLANAAALQACNIRRETSAPGGGEILRDAAGAPTGVLIDNAMNLVSAARAAGGAVRPTGTRELLSAAQDACLKVGLTGVHDAGVSPVDIAEYRRLDAARELKLRIYAMIAGSYAIPYFSQNPPLIGERLTVRAAKVVFDGALGSRGALLLAPYSDRAKDDDGRDYVGLRVTPAATLRAIADAAVRHGYQVCTHAIGDRANRETLDVYEAALNSFKLEHRFRIEHAQLLSPDDIPRFARLRVVASVQPTHCTSDMRWAEQRVGPERARGAYAWASLRKSGARVAGGSDFPVESQNPFLGIYAAVTRQNLEQQPAEGWHAEQRMTRKQALQSFTIDAAYAAFEDQEKGSLSAGKLADFIVIDRDVMTCPTREIADTRVLMTVIGGEVVYRVVE